MKSKIQKIITTMLVLAFVTGCFAAIAPAVNAAPTHTQNHGHRHNFEHCHHIWSDYDYSQSRYPNVPQIADPVITCELCGCERYVCCWTETVVEPTCVADGYTQYENQFGWTTAVYDYGSAIGHLWGDFDYSQGNVPFADPVAECLRCGWRGYVYSWEITEVEATCTADGYTEYENSGGWKGWIYDEGSALGHLWGDFDYSQGHHGSMPDPVATCERCGWAGYVYSWKITEVKATCTADGYTEYERSDGWKGWIYDEGSARGHDFVDDVTWDGFGWWSGVCKDCGWAGYLESEVAASAFVTKLTGNTNDLTITVTNTYDEEHVETFTETFSINNNSAGTFAVGPYNVYVDTYGNDKIRACDIV